MTDYDVIIVGLGGMGSSAAYHLARRGVRVLGLEQFNPGHDLGSSHGDSRVIRQSYFEHPDYVPLLLRAYELWREIEAESGQELLTETGGLMMGPVDSEVIKGSLASAKLHGLPHQMLTREQIAERFPVFSPPAGTIGFLEPHAGFVRPERSVLAHISGAQVLGADLHFHSPALNWTSNSGGVEVSTATGTYRADHLVITAGPWAANPTPHWSLPLAVERQVLYWFDVPHGIDDFAPENFPVYILDEGGGSYVYGFPALDGPTGGVKVAFYRDAMPNFTSADTVNRTVSAEEIERIYRSAAALLPSLSHECLRYKTCLYTMTPDQHFVIDHLPNAPNTTIAAGFSGHGFKFASVVGEILADLATVGTTRHPIARFKADRFNQT